jgi:hypothetical protein
MTTPNVQKNPLFEVGQTVITPTALEALQQAGISVASLLCRHQSGDWGDLNAEDKAENNEALRLGSRLYSSYPITETTWIWVITESNRSGTLLLLHPEDY